MEYRRKKKKNTKEKRKDERDQKETGGSPLCLGDGKQVKQRQLMCVWERFPRVSRAAGLLGILGPEGFTFFCVHTKSGRGAVSRVQLTAAPCPGYLQSCSYLSRDELTLGEVLTTFRLGNFVLSMRQRERRRGCRGGWEAGNEKGEAGNKKNHNELRPQVEEVNG